MVDGLIDCVGFDISKHSLPFGHRLDNSIFGHIEISTEQCIDMKTNLIYECKLNFFDNAPLEGQSAQSKAYYDTVVRLLNGESSIDGVIIVESNTFSMEFNTILLNEPLFKDRFIVMSTHGWPDKSIRIIANKLKNFPIFNIFDIDNGGIEIDLKMKFGSFMLNSNYFTSVPHAINVQAAGICYEYGKLD